jgi:xanthine dehydrogenase accessory factor
MAVENSPLWNDDQAALRFAALHPAALCTIVGIDGSYSRRLGGQLAIGRDGSLAGSLADGCLERELESQSVLARQAGHPVVLRFGKSSPFIDFRLPCGSGLDILIDPEPESADLLAAVAALDRRMAASLSIPVPQERLLAVRTYLPGLRLLVLGDSAEALALVQLAAAFGTECVEVRPGPGLALGKVPSDLSADRWTAIVLLFHNHEWETAILKWALETPAGRVPGRGVGFAGSEADRTRAPHKAL